ncbi:hypothetical protein EJ06DRAFT_469453 [Trichodelitschia bisporula]|uniref:NADH dehydrogenase [ubiquinone] 1 alpha subcomplex assembly factor 3 n=1 Tax=Trichodelitschia bisporula TaxID=703511 RepID=A0A6G1I7S8_9PEZI|nr:hypothetical protein EJ06DRAFT_469453 [Trichodelitschia bisporula]
MSTPFGSLCRTIAAQSTYFTTSLRTCQPHFATTHNFTRSFTTTAPRSFAPSTSYSVHIRRAPRTHDRGPASSEDTQTDFGKLNVLGDVPVPATSIDACLEDGFDLSNGARVAGAGVLLVGGEAFRWRPWVEESGGRRGLLNEKGAWEVDRRAWGVLGGLWPKPDLLIIGTGPTIVPISPATRKHINGLGIRVEVQDTRNAASQFNLLATERGVEQVAAALIPIGWTEAVKK